MMMMMVVVVVVVPMLVVIAQARCMDAGEVGLFTDPCATLVVAAPVIILKTAEIVMTAVIRYG